MTKVELKRSLKNHTGGCVIQHNGWPCGSCFSAMMDNLKVPKKQRSNLWQSLLIYRGDYKLGEYITLTEEEVKQGVIDLKNILIKKDEVKNA